MNTIRRDMLKLTGGALAGAAVTPWPWRLLGDSAIWTQNWNWMPRVPRGERSERESVCTLCPAACAVKLRCVDSTPYGIFPAGGQICPAGLTGHHVAIHPLRLRETMHVHETSSTDAAIEAARRRLTPGRWAVLDLSPRRVASRLHRMHAQAGNGLYLEPEKVEGATAEAFARLMDRPIELIADLTRARTVVSVSTPILEGWASPRFAAKRGFHLIHAGIRRSRTADLADEWVQLQPGGELAFLLGLLEELRVEPRSAAARALRGNGPALVIADGDPFGGPLPAEVTAAAAAVNACLDEPCFLALPDRPDQATMATPRRLTEVADGSLDLLIIDEPGPGHSVPWPQIEKKLAPQGVTVAVTWNTKSCAGRAEWLTPTPVYLEAALDAPAPYDRAPGGTQVCAEVYRPPRSAVAGCDFVGAMLERPQKLADFLADAVKRPAPEAIPLTQRPDRLFPAGFQEARLLEMAREKPDGLTVAPQSWRLAPASPLLAKLWRESDLMQAPASAAAHPETIARWRLHDVQPDSRVQRDVLEVCAGPGYPMERPEVRS